MADGRSGSRTVWYIVGAIILVLLLLWIFGLFGAGDVAEVDGDEAVVTEEGVVTEEAVEDAAEDAEEAAD
jgi:hypothetical protein